jgi:hypothetical protein
VVGDAWISKGESGNGVRVRADDEKIKGVEGIVSGESDMLCETEGIE